MKTAEKLFEKYECLIPEEEMNSADMDFDIKDRRTDVIQYGDFIDALKEHDKEIVYMIEDMMDKEEEMNKLFDTDAYHYAVKFHEEISTPAIRVLTELRNRIDKRTK